MQRVRVIWLTLLSVPSIVLAIALGLFWHRLQAEEEVKTVPAFLPPALLNEPIQPIPTQLELDPKKVALGEKLYADPRLSHDGTISCQSCHDLGKGGTDQRARSVGLRGALGEVNAPTVFNSAFQFKQFWDGRADTLEAQIDGPLEASNEMGSTWPEVIAKLERVPEYVAAFAELYPEGLRVDTVKNAIATYERSLSTPNAPLDRFLRGDAQALTAEEKRGYLLFKEYGCIKCHQGIAVGGNMFQSFGVMANYFADRGHLTKADLGRFNVTGDEHDKYQFKVPSLRNVARTPPYFHDGSAATLQEAVAVMAKYELGRKLSAQEIESIVQFLKALTGQYRGQPL